MHHPGAAAKPVLEVSKIRDTDQSDSSISATEPQTALPTCDRAARFTQDHRHDAFQHQRCTRNLFSSSIDSISCLHLWALALGRLAFGTWRCSPRWKQDDEHESNFAFTYRDQFQIHETAVAIKGNCSRERFQGFCLRFVEPSCPARRSRTRGGSCCQPRHPTGPTSPLASPLVLRLLCFTFA